MKKISLVSLLVFLLVSCDKKTKVEKEVEEIPLEIKVERFDKIFFESPVEELPKIKKAYPEFFPEGVEDQVWIEKMTNPMWKELYSEVQKAFGDFGSEKADIEDVFRHAKYYFPETQTPEVITVIGEMDYNNKVIYTGDLLLISMELYLGKDHEYYQSEFPAYIRQNFEKQQLMPDIVSAFTTGKIAEPTNKNLLSQMIYAGKELYIKDLLLPKVSDADKIGYTPEQITWCEENEEYMWRYFVEGNLLYDSDSKLGNRFINKAPFSKFYLEIDNESPGRIGTWVGWQIVRSFIKKNDVSLEQFLQMDAVEIFNKSKYKPKK
ncbi:gliding motility-associated lipoprotein GldB [Flavobacterium arsenatis]|uniref:Gliding motility-associated lipoprotein GldB n=1 Tax=Flavobacterium arsenatis TaxID=1484332 RepID=A0ABU1TKC6_9FLAO|nr:gliding motility lipoprotein GldB [Flavobacterium arsenatis]MDR6966439.1 gliding motility-associated lipoprotein GldB [Flavobacterium arsenatis]